MLTLSIVIPVYNAEKTIGTLCSSLVHLYGEKYQLQIVLVNDGSKDDSDEQCRDLQATYPAVITYIKLARNFGEHNAVMAGLNHVAGDYCVIMDDDMQNPPEGVGRLVDEILKGYDIVYARYECKKDNLLRNLGSTFNGRIATLILRKPADLYLSSFKVMNRFLVREIIKYKGSTPYIDAIVLRTTDSVGSVRMEHRKREVNQSGYTFSKLIALWGNMAISNSLLPLRLSGITGLLLILAGPAYGLYKFLHGFPNSTLTDVQSLMSVNLFFRGLVMVAVSILGEYIGRIYLLLNKDPQFVIRERISSGVPLHSRVTSLSEYRDRDAR